jgi:hypothetical protein
VVHESQIKVVTEAVMPGDGIAVKVDWIAKKHSQPHFEHENGCDLTLHVIAGFKKTGHAAFDFNLAVDVGLPQCVFIKPLFQHVVGVKGNCEFGLALTQAKGFARSKDKFTGDLCIF